MSVLSLVCLFYLNWVCTGSSVSVMALVGIYAGPGGPGYVLSQVVLHGFDDHGSVLDTVSVRSAVVTIGSYMFQVCLYVPSGFFTSQVGLLRSKWVCWVCCIPWVRTAPVGSVLPGWVHTAPRGSWHSFIQGPNPPEFLNSPLLANSSLNFENIPSPPPLLTTSPLN